MKEGVDTEIIKLRRDILLVLKTTNRQEFINFVFARRKNEHIELKIAAILRLIILLYKENFNRNMDLLKREFYHSKTEQAVTVPEDEESISHLVDELTGENGSEGIPLIDLPIFLRDLMVVIENAILSEFRTIPLITEQNKDSQLRTLEDRPVFKIANDVVTPDLKTSRLMICCIRYLLASRFIKEEDIFVPTAK